MTFYAAIQCSVAAYYDRAQQRIVSSELNETFVLKYFNDRANIYLSTDPNIVKTMAEANPQTTLHSPGTTFGFFNSQPHVYGQKTINVTILYEVNTPLLHHSPEQAGEFNLLAEGALKESLVIKKASVKDLYTYYDEDTADHYNRMIWAKRNVV